jgi:hypothetical protein
MELKIMKEVTRITQTRPTNTKKAYITLLSCQLHTSERKL